jgi:DNA polymerase-4
LKQPISTNQAIFDTGRQLLQTALSQEKQPVRLIGIGVASLVESGRQLNMLDTSIGRQERLDKAIDLIRKKYGFTSIQTGRTMRLKDLFPDTGEGYTLNTPSLSR